MKMFNEYASPILEIIFLREDIVRTSPNDGIPDIDEEGQLPIDPDPFGNIF